jgi:hypothetical protein
MRDHFRAVVWTEPFSGFGGHGAKAVWTKAIRGVAHDRFSPRDDLECFLVHDQVRFLRVSFFLAVGVPALEYRRCFLGPTPAPVLIPPVSAASDPSPIGAALGSRSPLGAGLAARSAASPLGAGLAARSAASPLGAGLAARRCVLGSRKCVLGSRRTRGCKGLVLQWSGQEFGLFCACCVRAHG